jgi:large subunit ribosomal protein L13
MTPRFRAELAIAWRACSGILAGFPVFGGEIGLCAFAASEDRKVPGAPERPPAACFAAHGHSKRFRWGRVIRSYSRFLFQDPLMKTFSAKPAEVTHEWLVIDATDKVLGRVASEVALRLRGKHKAIYTPHVDTGDFIIVLNADKIRVTGNKANDKIYYRHSGFPGGIYATKFKDMQAKHPGRALEKAVKGMLPKGPLGYAMIKKLKVYAGDTHPHAAQQPKALEI